MSGIVVPCTRCGEPVSYPTVQAIEDKPLCPGCKRLPPPVPNAKPGGYVRSPNKIRRLMNERAFVAGAETSHAAMKAVAIDLTQEARGDGLKRGLAIGLAAGCTVGAALGVFVSMIMGVK